MNVMRSWRFIRVILHTFATMRQHCFSTVLAVLDDADDSDRDLFSNWDFDLFSAMCNAVFKSSSVSSPKALLLESLPSIEPSHLAPLKK